MSGTTPGVVHDQNIDILYLYLLHILSKIFNSNIILFIVTIVPLTNFSFAFSVCFSVSHVFKSGSKHYTSNYSSQPVT